MLIFLAALSAVGGPTASAAAPDRPPVQIWMNNDRRFREGERVRLQIDAEVDGYLLVLNYETDGNIRVLFPLDPRDDARVRAGRRYEVRDESGTTAFRAGQEGSGWIYSAVSADPWRFDDVVQGDRWDYNRLFIDRDSDNPEAALTELVQQLGGAGGFDYDVAGYRVYGVTTYSYGDYYSRGPIYVYDDYSYCNGWWGCYGYCCSRWPYGGWSIGFTFGSFYPYRYGYWPYRYGYSPYYPYYDYPYYPYRPFYYPSGPLRRGPVLVGRPRSYDVFPRSGTHLASGTRFGSGIRGVRGSTGSATLPPVNWRPRSVARPAADRGPVVTRGPAERRIVSPPARRARSESPSYSVPGARSEDGRGRPSDPSPRARGDDARGRPDVSSPRARSDGARARPSYSSPRVRNNEARGRPSDFSPGTRSDDTRGRLEYSSPRARGDEGRGRPSYSTPAPRATGRDAPSYSTPRARGGEPRSRGDYAAPGRAEPRAHSPPARAEPRTYNAPSRSQPTYRGSGSGGGGGGSRAYGGGGGGGGGSRASGGGGSRSRRP